MKIQYYFGMLFLLCANTYDAYSSYHDTNLVEQIKPNPIARSKPTTSAYTKYASVSFLKSDTDLSFKGRELDVKTQCAILGYVIPVSKCTGALKPSYLCSSETSMAGVTGANQYTTSCCNSNLYTADSRESCTNNSTALNDYCYWGGKRKYRCACDRSRYPYSSKSGEGCGSNGAFNVNNMCQAKDADGNTISYYSSCCPSSYQECDGNKHLVGKGNSCRIEGANNKIITKYEFCECSSSYDTICPDAMLINASDTCTDLHGKFTRDNNCESGCTQSVETNLDNYFYGNVWHCLYRGDGASIKAGEGSICDGYEREEDNSVSLKNDYYDECIAQGYTKIINDCYNSNLILHCPSNPSKVWCLDSKYCTGFDVGNNVNGNACVTGAKVTMCGSVDQGKRCTYLDAECNGCWNDGQYTASGCPNLDTSTKGDSNRCCKLGYKMEGGICVKNVCNRNLYPYDFFPGRDQGELESCYEADLSKDLGYKIYYGYASCYTKDNSEGGMWKVDTNTENLGYGHRCVCERQDNERGWLPFNSDLYYDAYSDTSENYIHVGYNAGQYGVQTSCTDADGSYYGYSSCYIGTKAGWLETNKGMCINADSTGNSTNHSLLSSTNVCFNSVTDTATAAGISSITKPARPITNNLPDSSKVYCVNYNQHCKDGKGSEDVCDLTYNPLDRTKQCLTGTEAACSVCYHISSVKQEGGRYELNGKYKLRVLTYDNGSTILFGFETCPPKRPFGGINATGGASMCYKRCSVSNLSTCLWGDIITDGATDLGVVYYKNGNTLYVAATGIDGATKKHAAAMTYAANYEPASGYSGDSRFRKGQWALPTKAQLNSSVLPQYAAYSLNGVYKSLSKPGGVTDAWTQTDSGNLGAYIRNCCDTTITYNKETTSHYAIPIVTITY